MELKNEVIEPIYKLQNWPEIIPGVYKNPVSKKNSIETEIRNINFKFDQLLSCGLIKSMLSFEKRCSTSANLENCIGALPEEVDPVAYSRPMVLIGYDEQGKPKYKRISGNNQNEINDKIVKAYVESGRIFEFLPVGFLDQFTDKLKVSMPSIEKTETKKHDFTEYAWNEYFKFKEKSWGKNTIVRERGALNHLCGFFEGKYIEDLTFRDVQAFMDDQAEKGLSVSAIESKRKTLGQVFSFALSDGIPLQNNANPAQNPRLRNNGYESDGTIPLSFDEYQTMLQGISKIVDVQTRLAVAILSLTGIRREELLGLRWSDIDFDNRTIYIQRAIIYPYGSPEEAPPKSKAGYRHIPIDDQLYDILMEYKQDLGNIIHDESGGILTEDGTEKMLANIRAATGIDRIDCHVFRTTFATMIAASGKMPPKNLQVIMGHSNIKVTMDVYAKAEKTMISMNRNVLSEIFQGIAN